MRGKSFREFKSRDVRNQLHLANYLNQFEFDSSVPVENYIFPQEMLTEYCMAEYCRFEDYVSRLSLN